MRRRVNRREAAGVVGVAVVLVIAALGAAVAGPWEMEERDFSFLLGWLESDDTLPPIDLGTLPEFEFEQAPGSGRSFDLSWMRGVAVALAILAAAAVVAWLVNRFFRTKDPEPVTPPRVEGLASEPELPEIPVLQRGLRAAQRMLVEGPVSDDAIIAAWLTLEAAAADAGVTRRPAQTPTEFAVAVLNRTAADASATQRLLALYRRARFSPHPASAEDMAEAVGCLERLAESWDLPASVAGTGR